MQGSPDPAHLFCLLQDVFGKLLKEDVFGKSAQESNFQMAYKILKNRRRF